MSDDLEPDPRTPTVQPDRWLRAREEFLAGDTAAVVAERHGLTERSVRRRAAREGWRRGDAPSAPPDFTWNRASLDDLAAAHPELTPVLDQNAADLMDLLITPDPDSVSRVAFRRAAEAVAAHKPTQAAAWLRVVALTSRCGDAIERRVGSVSAADWLRAASVAAFGEEYDDDRADRTGAES